MNLTAVTEHFHENPSPALIEFTKNQALQHSRYLFTQKVVGNMYKGYCTHCGKESCLEGSFKHLQATTCPNCKTSCLVFQAGRGRGKLVDTVYVEFFEKSLVDSQAITAAGYYITKDYRESYTDPSLTFERLAMYVFKAGEAVMYSRSMWDREFSRNKSVFSLHNTPSFGRQISFMNVKNLGKITKGTAFEYAMTNTIDNHLLIDYLALFCKYPYVELLIKMNMKEIVLERLNGMSTKGAINWRGKTLDSIIGLPKREWKHFGKLEQPVSATILRHYKALRKLDASISPDELIVFVQSLRIDYYLEKFVDIVQMTKLAVCSAIHYIHKQQDVYKDHLNVTRGTISTWHDYLNECRQMNLDVTGRYATPKDLYTMHQKQIERKKAIADAKLNLKIKRRFRELSKFTIEYGDFIVRPVASAEELTKEGHELHHCIANYAESYAEKKSDLFVVRLKSEPDQPLYSAEVSVEKQQIYQVRGMRNSVAPEEVEAVVKTMLGIGRSKSISEQAM